MVSNDYAHRPILVVEDDEDIRETIADALQDEGHAVELAGNGVEALDLVRRADSPRPCLIILDLMMPGMNGWAFRAELMKDTALSSIPIVVLSGVARLEDQAARLGCVASIGKPMSLARLLEVVEKFC